MPRGIYTRTKPVWNKTNLYKPCHKCGYSFKYIKARENIAKFCSIQCAKGYNIFDEGHIPWNKGKPHMRGEKHPNWKGGVDKEHTRIKQTKQYKEWRDKVYRKWYWTCQDCNKHCNRKQIVAHHIKTFAEYPKLRFRVSNGLVLCRPCHALRHKPRRKDYYKNRLWNSK